jgi:hypothetical protein
MSNGKKAYYIESDEMYPVFELKVNNRGEGYIELTKEEFLDFDNIEKNYYNWQARLKEASDKYFENTRSKKPDGSK